MKNRPCTMMPGVARRREVVRSERAIDEVVLRHARQRVEPEGHFEAADLHLRVLDERQVDQHVLPLILRRDAGADVFFGQLFLGELALDLVLDLLEEVPLEADAIAMQLELFNAGQPQPIGIRTAAVFLELRLEVEPEGVPDAKRGMLLP